MAVTLLGKDSSISTQGPSYCRSLWRFRVIAIYESKMHAKLVLRQAIDFGEALEESALQLLVVLELSKAL
jgi:hypothetical protein